MINPDHISKSVKNKFLDVDPRSGMEKSRIRDKHADPQHWRWGTFLQEEEDENVIRPKNATGIKGKKKVPRKLPDWMGMKDALDTVADTSSGPPPHAEETKGRYKQRCGNGTVGTVTF
jgi:hypothetical protein